MHLNIPQTYKPEETQLYKPQTYSLRTIIGKLKRDKDEKLGDDEVPLTTLLFNVVIEVLTKTK